VQLIIDCRTELFVFALKFASEFIGALPSGQFSASRTPGRRSPGELRTSVAIATGTGLPLDSSWQGWFFAPPIILFRREVVAVIEEMKSHYNPWD
jgi:hypothetical protein